MFIDDERFPVKDDFIIVRSVAEAILEIEKHDQPPNYISFDHDLGDNVKTGFDLAKWLVEKDLDYEGSFLPNDFSFYVHSANPVGKENIEGLLNNYLEYRLNQLKQKKTKIKTISL